MRRLAMRLCGIILFFAVMAAASAQIVSEDERPPRGEGMLTVHYLDVGQSDCTLVEVEGEYTVMIDASDEAHADEVCGYVRALGYNSIDVLVLTHPHSDHIGGAERVIDEFRVETVYMTDTEAHGEDAVYLGCVEDKIEEYGIERINAEEGAALTLGRLDGCFLAPCGVYFEDENEMSAILSLSYGEHSFLFMGDAGEDAEGLLLDRGVDVSATVVKAGHHGSGGSSSRDFVEATGAEYVVISCGDDNDYGHPSTYAIDRWERAGAHSFRTDKDADVVACTDGESIAVGRASDCEFWSEGRFSCSDTDTGEQTSAESEEYLLNTDSHILHVMGCVTLAERWGENIEPTSEDTGRLLAEGYKKCSHCFGWLSE